MNMMLLTDALVDEQFKLNVSINSTRTNGNNNNDDDVVHEGGANMQK